MKKLLICCNIVFLLLLPACSTQKVQQVVDTSGTISNSDTKAIDITVQTEPEMTNGSEFVEIYDIYSMSNLDINRYLNAVDYAAIDAAYDSDFNQAITTIEFVTVQQKYIDIWKNELNTNLQSLLDMLSEQEQNDFLELQSCWEEQTINTAQADRIVLINEPMGSAFEWQWLSSIRHQYRNRAIHLKYLIYIKEVINTKQGDGSVS